MNYQFDWSILWTGQSGAWLLQGLITTLQLTLLAWCLAVMLGIVAGAFRTLPFAPLRIQIGIDAPGLCGQTLFQFTSTVA